MSLRLYPTVVVKKQSFVGAKIFAVPQQSMTLREIILRFTRKESLPIEKQGVYHEQFGDLEKAQHEDITVRMERAEELKSRIAKGKKAFEEREKAAKAKAVESPPPAPTPPGVVTGSAGSGQAPAPSRTERSEGPAAS